MLLEFSLNHLIQSVQSISNRHYKEGSSHKNYISSAHHYYIRLLSLMSNGKKPWALPKLSFPLKSLINHTLLYTPIRNLFLHHMLCLWNWTYVLHTSAGSCKSVYCFGQIISLFGWDLANSGPFGSTRTCILSNLINSSLASCHSGLYTNWHLSLRLLMNRCSLWSAAFGS